MLNLQPCPYSLAEVNRLPPATIGARVIHFLEPIAGIASVDDNGKVSFSGTEHVPAIFGLNETMFQLLATTITEEEVAASLQRQGDPTEMIMLAKCLLTLATISIYPEDTPYTVAFIGDRQNRQHVFNTANTMIPLLFPLMTADKLPPTFYLGVDKVMQYWVTNDADVFNHLDDLPSEFFDNLRA